MVGRSMHRLALRSSIKKVFDSTYLNLAVEELRQGVHLHDQ